MYIQPDAVLPLGSMYGIFPYIWLMCMVNVGKYTSPMDPMGYEKFTRNQALLMFFCEHFQTLSRKDKFDHV